jgi:hypothetical protein
MERAMRGSGSEAPGKKPGTSGAAGTREDRLKAALKANMARRKAQARARAAQQADGPGGAADGDNDARTGADE